MLDQLLSRRTLHEAFGRVRENGGCPGADGVTLDRFAADLEAELDSLEDRLRRRCYRPFPLLRIELPKPTGGIRHLAVPTIRDRVLQTAVFLLTRPIFEAEFEECSHAFRQGRSVRSAVRTIHELREQGYRYVVDADIDIFFDTIPH
ncbi:MAG: reverse transcriptase domain-containing protein, partial [Thermoanaerobaculia bacterium]